MKGTDAFERLRDYSPPGIVLVLQDRFLRRSGTADYGHRCHVVGWIVFIQSLLSVCPVDSGQAAGSVVQFWACMKPTSAICLIAVFLDVGTLSYLSQCQSEKEGDG